jgi:hypothetical protein
MRNPETAQIAGVNGIQRDSDSDIRPDDLIIRVSYEEAGVVE